MPSRRPPARHLDAIVLLTSCLFLSGLLPGCSNSSETARRQAGRQLVPAVEAVRAKHGSLPLTERLSGVVRAKNQVELYPEISAAVLEVFVQNGDLVAAGEPLVRLRDTELREQLRQAEASYQIAVAQSKQAEAERQRMVTELQRSTKLADQDLISSTEYETIQTEAIAAEADAELAAARVKQAQATVDERKDALARTVVRAPVRGSVGNRNAEVGMVVTPGKRLFTLGQLDSVRVEVVLTDRMLSYIKAGQRATISSPGLSFGGVDARLSRVSPFLHPISHSTTGEIDLVNPGNELRPGMFVPVDLHYGESEQATLVPLSALWENPATASVGIYVCRDSITGEPVARLDDVPGSGLTDPVSFEFVPVEVIAQGRMSAGVRGIDAGSWVVTIGQDLLEGDSAQARVRFVNWEWIEKLQQLQREDLLDEIIRRRQTGDSSMSKTGATAAGSREQS